MLGFWQSVNFKRQEERCYKVKEKFGKKKDLVFCSGAYDRKSHAVY